MPGRNRKLILSSDRINDSVYYVTETHNMLSPRIGTIVKECEVERYVRDRNVNVIIRDKKK